MTNISGLQGLSGLDGASTVGKAKSVATDGGFAAALEEAAKSAHETLGKAESVSMDAVAGKAELLDVVTAVNDAESTLRTVVAVRDKVMQSYQEILRMPV